VGEATVPTLRDTLRQVGIDEHDWMRAAGASFKLAIEFVGWSGRSERDVYWHPFGGAHVPKVDGLSLAQYCTVGPGEQGSVARRCFASVPVCEARRAPRMIGDRPYEGAVDYAYHLDAIELARFLRSHAVARGVAHVDAKVVDTELDERGFIRSIRLDDGRSIGGDMFIDCTGFRSLLLGKALGVPFEDYGRTLLCNRAVAIGAPHEPGAQIEPYTTATAFPHGWIWRIPLYRRAGLGYVYSDAFTSAEDAEQTLRRVAGPTAQAQPVRHIAMRIGRHERLWVKNCVAVGLAGGFIEPLESTGIFLIEMGLRHLVQHFPNRSFDERVASLYNEVMAHHYEHIRDFILLHYRTSRRRDTEFWRAQQSEVVVPDALQGKLELWKSMFPIHEPMRGHGLFTDVSFACILSGMGLGPTAPPPLSAYGSAADAADEFRAIEQRAGRLVRSLPSHVELLDHIHGGRGAAVGH
jgi:tryptophan halogenase